MKNDFKEVRYMKQIIDLLYIEKTAAGIYYVYYCIKLYRLVGLSYLLILLYFYNILVLLKSHLLVLEK